jgi:hypothetical protein
MTSDVRDEAGLATPATHREVNHVLNTSRVTEEYFQSIIEADATIDHVARTRVLLDSDDAATRALAAKYWPIIWKKYFREGRQASTYYFGHHAAWGIVLRTDGSVDYEYPIEIASLVTAKWEMLVHECSAAIDEAARVLKGRQRKIHTVRLFAQLHTLFSAIDAVVDRPDSQTVAKRLEETLTYTGEKIEELSQSVRSIAVQTDRRVAQQEYLLGMLPGLIIVGGLVFAASKLPHAVSNIDLEVALAGGALGALLSVMGRTTSAQFSKSLRVDTQAGAPLIISAGAFRPIVGALLALVVYVLIEAGLLPIKIPAYPQSLFFIPAISFLAGFSERLAQDALVRTSRSTFGFGHAEQHHD